jgi:hypothetical protein
MIPVPSYNNESPPLFWERRFMIHLRVWTASAVRQGEQAKVKASLVKAGINVR